VPLPALRRPCGRTLSLACLALGAAAAEAHAFEIRNATSSSITVWTEPGSFRQDIAPGATRSCEWTDRRCNPEGGLEARLSLWVVIPGAHFACVVALGADGTAVVSEQPRMNLPHALSCQTYSNTGALVATEPLADHAGTRSVRFLATADPQFWWEDKAVLTEPDRNPSARHTLWRMTRELADSCLPSGCEIRGITVSGDLTQYSRRNEFEWYTSSVRDYLRYVYDGLGNHDLEPDTFPINLPKCAFFPDKCVDLERIRGHVSRDRQRSTAATNAGDPHYSWDWDDVHLVHLNLVPRDTPNRNMPRLFSFDALRFLADDLARYVGTSGRPVILFHHYGFDVAESAHPAGTWWTADQRRDYWNVIATYNVAAIFTGHNHFGRGDDPFIAWRRPDGASGGPDSIATFVAGAALNGAFVDVQIDDGRLIVRRMGLSNPLDSLSALVQYHSREIPLRTMQKRSCRAGLLYLLGNDHVEAAFRVPDAGHGVVVGWYDGSAATYRFPRCYRVWWEKQSATCSDGTWLMNPSARLGRDAGCTSANADQPFLDVRYP
jgi:hypothetical protein